MGEPFELDSISAAKPPPGTDGIDWRRYVISQGDRTIVGHRQGSQQSVKLAIEDIVVLLNERRIGKPGRNHLVINPKKKT
jgi:hypothetical protein